MIFAQTKASVLGDYVAAKLGFDEGENAVKMVVTKDYKGMLLFAFENGKAAKVPLESYATKTNRKKLTGAYSDKSPLVGLLYIPEDEEVLFKASSGKYAPCSHGCTRSQNNPFNTGCCRS